MRGGASDGETDLKRTRVPLDAKEHLLGVGLAFPEADDLTPQPYVSVELPGTVEEDPWEPGGDEDEGEALEKAVGDGG